MVCSHLKANLKYFTQGSELCRISGAQTCDINMLYYALPLRLIPPSNQKKKILMPIYAAVPPYVLCRPNENITIPDSVLCFMVPDITQRNNGRELPYHAGGCFRPALFSGSLAPKQSCDEAPPTHCRLACLRFL